MAIRGLLKTMCIAMFAVFVVPAATSQTNHSSALVHSKSPAAFNSDIQDNFARIFIFYPLSGSASGINLFLNKKYITRISNGGRLECRLLQEGTLAITASEEKTYREPLTQSKNSRTISIKKGRSYYFRLTGTGELDYVFSVEKGEKSFANSKDYTAPPTSFIETVENRIPDLATAKN